MAMLRITSSKVVPYAVRAISSGRSLSASITNAFNGGDQLSFPICHHFSTDAKKQSDHKLAKFLKSEIKSKKMFLERTMPAIPNDFHFTIKDDPNDGGDVINLTRDFHGEKIDVVVTTRFAMDVDDVDSDDVDTSDDDSNTRDDGDISNDSDDSDVTSSSDSEKDENEKKDESEPLDLKVTVSKQNGKISEFNVSASAEEIKITSVILKEPAPESSDPLLSFGPYYVEEEGDLQIALREYLKIRGMEKSNYGFLYKYLLEKSRKHPVVALKMLRNFIKE